MGCMSARRRPEATPISTSSRVSARAAVSASASSVRSAAKTCCWRAANWSVWPLLSLVFMDTTSLSFYGAGGESLGAYGHSKDHRADLKEMILAVVIDGEGWPICTEMLPGNTADAIVLLPVVDRLRERFHIGRVCIDQLWLRVPGYKPLSVGIVLLDLVPAGQHQPDLFAADNRKRQ